MNLCYCITICIGGWIIVLCPRVGIAIGPLLNYTVLFFQILLVHPFSMKSFFKCCLVLAVCMYYAYLEIE